MPQSCAFIEVYARFCMLIVKFPSNSNPVEVFLGSYVDY